MKKVFPFLSKKDNMSAPGRSDKVPSSDKSEVTKSNDYENKDSGGSATGNPRNKCALKPGHSLMDWIRLGTSGTDLAGTKGVITPISSTELAKHCNQNDAWMAIRGKVYNVTKYMDFHPGGVEELKRGIGKDGTALFNQVHAWVNYEQLLAKCFIGPLRNIVQVDLEPIKPRQKATTPTPDCTENLNSKNLFSCDESDSFKKPILPLRLSNSEKNSPVKTVSPENNFIMNNLTDAISEKQQQRSLAEIVPRFDWIQNTSDLTLIFYTRPFSNPGLVVSYKTFSEINIRIFIEFVMHEFSVKFNNDIKWPCIIKISKETGKIDIICKKTEPQLWTIYGNLKLENTYKNNYNYSDKYEFEIENCEQINHDSFGLILKSNEQVSILTPVGHHLSLTALINGDEVTRSYTPVPLFYLPHNNLNVSYKIAMLIKSYPKGTLAKFITDQSHNQLKVKLSAPKGNFSLLKLLDHNRVALLAAGSGITPILGLLEHLLGRNNNRLEHIELFIFNKTQKDIWCKEQLETIASQDERINIRYILSDSDNNWNGEKGRISEDLIAILNDNTKNSFVTFCCICGPRPFNDLALKFLTTVGFSTEQLHFFQG
ncbi:cytochrome b5 reductase 4 [Condylostylus longicornis]|uniref:cytochrome b5 reductase 4 n=1 Tax=Condylostylus longicornis TaxID=2530218 RepID=UPI00244DA7CB|nr:cytochrome b5 reductase 4 [Condylostylus longicornis]